MGENCPICGLSKEICTCESVVRGSQEIRITTDRRKYGKWVTIIKGINATDVNLDELARELKGKCACGGTVKNDEIELQGNHATKLKQILLEMGFPVQ